MEWENNQLWKVISVAGNYYIQTKNGGVIDIQNGTLNAGTNVQTFTWNATNAQRWSFVQLDSYTGSNVEKAFIQFVQLQIMHMYWILIMQILITVQNVQLF